MVKLLLDAAASIDAADSLGRVPDFFPSAHLGACLGGRRLRANTTYIGSISASPTACLLRGYGCVGTQNDRLSEYQHAHTRAMDMPSAMPK